MEVNFTISYNSFNSSQMQSNISWWFGLLIKALLYEGEMEKKQDISLQMRQWSSF